MERRAFGRTGLDVSVLGFGSWPMSGEDRYGAIEDTEAIEPRGVPVSQVALAWVLGNPAVSVALVGALTPDEFDRNRVGTELRLTAEELGRIDTIMTGAAGTIAAFTPLRPAIEEWV